MTTAQTSRPFKLELKAGVPQNISQRSEFVFIDQGRDLVVRCDSSIHDGVQAGDKIRPSAPFDQITLISPTDQVVSIRAGWGDWDRLIISGEVNVSAYIDTAASGASASLPMTIERECGLDNQIETSYSASEILYTTTIPTEASTSSATIFFNGVFYAFLDNGIYYRFSEAMASGVIEGPFNWFQYPAGDPIEAATVSNEGMVYIRFQSGEIYRFSLSDAFFVAELVGSLPAWISGYAGFHYFGGRLYFYGSPGFGDKFIFSVPVSDTSDTRVEYQGSNLSMQLVGYGPYMRAFGDNSVPLLIIMGDGQGVVNDFGNMSSGQGNESGALDNTGKVYGEFTSGNGANGTALIGRPGNFTTEGALYIQPPGVPARKQLIELWQGGATVALFDTPAGQTIAFDWIRNILTTSSAPGYFADALTSYKYDDGIIEREINSGTQTFALRGIPVPESLSILDGSTVTLKVLPNLFD